MTARYTPHRPLQDGWRLRLGRAPAGAPAGLTDLDVAASVPGCVHTDLLAAGRLADPDVGTAARDQEWIGRSEWIYSTSFDWSDAGAEQVDLVSHGLDTVATVVLNGEVIARTQNMHRSYRWPVREVLHAGANDLEVRFAPVHELTDAVRAEVGELPSPAPGPQGYVRKMGANFGTDWLAPMVTAGIWRPIELHSWGDGRIDGVRPLVAIDDDGVARVDVHVDVAGSEALNVRVELDEVVVSRPVEAGHAHVAVDIAQPRLWWPVGLGEPHRYRLVVQLRTGDTVADEWHRDIGLRTVEVVETPDEVGRRWAIHINGRRVPVRGFNWIPLDPFPARVGRDRYERRIAQAVAANANLLRVWGGATYEAETFYKFCDEQGLLVWQDFMFSCATYPETPQFRAEVEAEVREVVTRLSAHPSVVLWNGNNECIWGYHDWAWQPVLQGRPWGAGYYLDLLPGVLAELDPTRPYLSGSPWGGDIDHAPNDPSVGVTHLWDMWNQLDYAHYRDYAPSFVPEMGWCGPPTWATLRRAVPTGTLRLDNPDLAYHFRAEDGGPAKLARGLHAHFRPVEDDDDWLFLAQVVQARAMTVAVDHLRGLERCAGAVVWQLHDCWPVISWSAIDDDGRPKPVWYALRAAFAPRRCTVQPAADDGADGAGGLDLVLVNDAGPAWNAVVQVRRLAFDGAVLAEQTITLTAESTTLHRLPLPADLAVPGEPCTEVLVVDVDGVRTLWFWAEDADVDFPRAEFDVSTEVVEGGLTVAVTARTFLRDLALFPDRLLRDGNPLDARSVVDDLLITLLPGESHTFVVPGADESHRDAVARRPVLRCVNDIGYRSA